MGLTERDREFLWLLARAVVTAGDPDYNPYDYLDDARELIKEEVKEGGTETEGDLAGE